MHSTLVYFCSCSLRTHHSYEKAFETIIFLVTSALGLSLPCTSNLLKKYRDLLQATVTLNYKQTNQRSIRRLNWE